MQGLLTAADLSQRPEFPLDQVDYGAVIEWKTRCLEKAFIRFNKKTGRKLAASFAAFRKEQSGWLEDFTLFMAIKEAMGGINWGSWPLPLRKRDEQALKSFSREHAADIDRYAFLQFLFYTQWSDLKHYANKKGIRIMGDMPLYIAYDSSDCWSHPELFSVNQSGQLTAVAGVPPDYFSPTGQLWGNPLYRWSVHARQGFGWWIDRVRSALNLFDFLRVDHFRGLAAYWEIKAGAKTAEIGRWVKGSGCKLFKALEKAIQPLPVIAEDLGVITPDVTSLA